MVELHLRGNYAGIGYTWDEDNEIFWPKKPYTSWTKNTTTASWDAPITRPSITLYTEGTWTQTEIDNGQAPEGVSAGDVKERPYNIYWDEAAYQADNTKGWKATKKTDTSDPKTVYEWNGSSLGCNPILDFFLDIILNSWWYAKESINRASFIFW